MRTTTHATTETLMSFYLAEKFPDPDTFIASVEADPEDIYLANHLAEGWRIRASTCHDDFRYEDSAGIAFYWAAQLDLLTTEVARDGRIVSAVIPERIVWVRSLMVQTADTRDEYVIDARVYPSLAHAVKQSIMNMQEFCLDLNLNGVTPEQAVAQAEGVASGLRDGAADQAQGEVIAVMPPGFEVRPEAADNDIGLAN